MTLTATSTPTPGPSFIRLHPNQAVANAGNLPVIIRNETAFVSTPANVRLGTVELLHVTQHSTNTLHAVIPIGSLNEGVHTLKIE